MLHNAWQTIAQHSAQTRLCGIQRGIAGSLSYHGCWWCPHFMMLAPWAFIWGVGFCPHSKSIRLWYNYKTQTTFVRREQCTYTHTYTKQSKICCCSLKGSQPQRQINGSQELLCCPTCALCLMLQLQSTDVHSPLSLLGLLLAAILLLDHFQATKQAPVGHRINQQYQEFSAIHKVDMGRG